MSVKVFVIHHKVSAVFQNEVFAPIQTGSDFSGVDLGCLKDNSGDNIAAKNPFYGELTAWYWVLKNWLPLHPEVSHIGFSHYRRVLDMSREGRSGQIPFRAVTWSEFEELFGSNAYSANIIDKAVRMYDLIFPVKESLMSFRCNFAGNVYDQYTQFHPQEALDRCVAFAVKNGLASAESVKNTLCGVAFHTCLNFVARRDLFESLVEWMLRLLDGAFPELGKNTDLPYNELRAPAFVAERFLDVWLSQQSKDLRIKECAGYLIGDNLYPHDFPWYLSGVKQWLLWKTGIKKHRPLPAIIA